jgi:hypothetical protein
MLPSIRYRSPALKECYHRYKSRSVRIVYLLIGWILRYFTIYHPQSSSYSFTNRPYLRIDLRGRLGNEKVRRRDGVEERGGLER